MSNTLISRKLPNFQTTVISLIFFCMPNISTIFGFSLDFPTYFSTIFQFGQLEEDKLYIYKNWEKFISSQFFIFAKVSMEATNRVYTYKFTNFMLLLTSITICLISFHKSREYDKSVPVDKS